MKQMTLTADIEHLDLERIIIAGAGEATIDWGDGTIEAITLPDAEYIRDLLKQKGPNFVEQCRHRYKAATTYTITITGDVALLLSCYDNVFHSLDVSNNPALKFLYCENNQLISLNVNGCTALTELECSSNQLTSLDVSGCTALTRLICDYNKLKILDVSSCTALTELECNYNDLTSLNVSGCTALTYLDCSVNKLTTLDVSGCTALTELECSDNKLTSLNVNGCTALKKLKIYRNPLTSLDVSDHTVLTKLYCDDNDPLSSLIVDPLLNLALDKHLELEEIDDSNTELPKYPYIYGDAKTGTIRAAQNKLEDVYWVDKKMIIKKMYQYFLRDIDEFAQSEDNKDIVAVVYCWHSENEPFYGRLWFMTDLERLDFYDSKCPRETDDELWKDVWEALSVLCYCNDEDFIGSEYALKRSIGGTKIMFPKEIEYQDDIHSTEVECAKIAIKMLLKESAFDKLNKTEDFIAFVYNEEDWIKEAAECARNLNNK